MYFKTNHTCNQSSMVVIFMHNFIKIQLDKTWIYIDFQYHILVGIGKSSNYYTKKVCLPGYHLSI